MKLENSTKNPPGLARIVAAYSVHAYTAAGIICALLATLALFKNDHRQTFFWLVVAFLVDASDGTLARLFKTKTLAASIDGRKLDDIVDYVNYTFVPLVLLASTDWLPEPVWLWVSCALLGSIFAFTNTGAKEEDEGFFLGFPSYWNVFVFYTAICFRYYGQGFVLGLLLFLSVLSVLPVRFIYPSHSPRWKKFFVFGGMAWLLSVSIILVQYVTVERIGTALVWGSLTYPLLYLVLSVYLDIQSRRQETG
jgi:phosphatidylcholine synthase